MKDRLIYYLVYFRCFENIASTIRFIIIDESEGIYLLGNYSLGNFRIGGIGGNRECCSSYM